MRTTGKYVYLVSTALLNTGFSYNQSYNLPSPYSVAVQIDKFLHWHKIYIDLAMQIGKFLNWQTGWPCRNEQETITSCCRLKAEMIKCHAQMLVNCIIVFCSKAILAVNRIIIFVFIVLVILQSTTSYMRYISKVSNQGQIHGWGRRLRPSPILAPNLAPSPHLSAPPQRSTPPKIMLAPKLHLLYPCNHPCFSFPFYVAS